MDKELLELVYKNQILAYKILEIMSKKKKRQREKKTEKRERKHREK